MSSRSAQHALNDAFGRLHNLVERYGPLNRGQGVNLFGGMDMIDHQVQGLPLNKLGVMVVAAAKIRQWEAVVGDAYVKKIDEEQPRAQPDEDALRLLTIAKMQSDGQSPAETQLPAPRCKPSSVVVDERYLYRLELENDLYRGHLSRYETEVADSLMGLLEDILCGTGQDAGGPDTLMKHQSDKLAVLGNDSETRQMTVKKPGKEEKEALVILQQNFNDNKNRGGAQ